MCIIAYKPAGTDFPDIDIMRNCFNANSDGAGIMFPKNGKVKYFKGIMTLGNFEKIYEKISTTLDKKIPMVFHFRISTHGKRKSPEHCHPFPIVDDYTNMEKLEGMADGCLMHNGILSKFGNDKFSDTMEFVKKVLSPFALSDIMKNETVHALIKNFQESSKFVIMDGSGNVKTFGDFILDNGIYYSNSTYKGYFTYIDEELDNMGAFPILAGDKVFTLTSNYRRFFRVKYPSQYLLGLDGETVFNRKTKKEIGILEY